MAEVAVPLDQGIVRLEDLEIVGTATLGGHGEDVGTCWMAACLLPKVVTGRAKSDRRAARTRKSLSLPRPQGFLIFSVKAGRMKEMGNGCDGVIVAECAKCAGK